MVLLQEVWLEADAALLRQAGAEGRLAHSFHWQSGAIGSGLLVFSRHPIEEVSGAPFFTTPTPAWWQRRWLYQALATMAALAIPVSTRDQCLPVGGSGLPALQVGFHPYSARGDPAAVLNGDFYAGKGAVRPCCAAKPSFLCRLRQDTALRADLSIHQPGVARLRPPLAHSPCTAAAARRRGLGGAADAMRPAQRVQHAPVSQLRPRVGLAGRGAGAGIQLPPPQVGGWADGWGWGFQAGRWLSGWAPGGDGGGCPHTWKPNHSPRPPHPPPTHLPRDSLAGVRLSQMLELAAFVRSRGAGSGAGVVLAGDLNSAPDTLEYAVLQVGETRIDCVVEFKSNRVVHCSSIVCGAPDGWVRCGWVVGQGEGGK